MICKFCGTNHNLYNCPNCGAVSHEVPIQETQKPDSPKRPEPAYAAPPVTRRKRSPAGRLIIAAACVCIMLFGISRAVLRPLSGGSVSSVQAVAASGRQERSVNAAREYGREGSGAYRTLDEAAYKEQAEFLDYDAVMRAPGDFVGKDLYTVIEISQVSESKEGGLMYMGYTMGPDGAFDGDYGSRNATRTVVYDFSGAEERYYQGEYLVVYGDFLEVRNFRLSVGSGDYPVLYGRYLTRTPEPETHLPDGGVSTGLLGTEAYRTLDEAAYKEQAEYLDYSAVLRTPGRYAGKDLYVVIQISQVQEDDRGRPMYYGYTMDADGAFDGDARTRMETRSLICDFSGAEERFYEKEYLVAYGDFLEIRNMSSLVGKYDIPVIQGRYLASTTAPQAHLPGKSSAGQEHEAE